MKALGIAAMVVILVLAVLSVTVWNPANPVMKQYGENLKKDREALDDQISVSSTPKPAVTAAKI